MDLQTFQHWKIFIKHNRMLYWTNIIFEMYPEQLIQHAIMQNYDCLPFKYSIN